MEELGQKSEANLGNIGAALQLGLKMVKQVLKGKEDGVVLDGLEKLLWPNRFARMMMLRSVSLHLRLEERRREEEYDKEDQDTCTSYKSGIPFQGSWRKSCCNSKSSIRAWW